MKPVPGTRVSLISAITCPECIAAGVAGLFLLNYFFWLVFPMSFAPIVCIVAATFAIIVFVIREAGRRRYLLLLSVAGGFLILFFAPLTDWDARSIWFFHAKRMYFDGSIAARLDDYAHWSHTPYPDFVPAAAASIARLFGIWNELLPKIALVLTLFPPLLVLTSRCETPHFRLLMLGTVLLLTRGSLLSGSMDAPLALYAISVIVLLRETLALPAKEQHPGTVMSAVVLLLCVASIKNEGAAMAALLSAPTALLLFRERREKTRFGLHILVGFLAGLPILIWKIQVSSAKIVGVFADDPFTRAAARISNGGWMVIATSLLAATGMSLIVILVVWLLARKAERLIWYFVVGYLALLFFVYLATPYEVAWYLARSAGRVTLIVKVLAGVLVVLTLERFILQPVATTEA